MEATDTHQYHQPESVLFHFTGNGDEIIVASENSTEKRLGRFEPIRRSP
jgi:hypothetical protein